MPGPLFDDLATGGGSPEAIAFLVRGERTRRLLLLRELLDRLDELPGVLGPLGDPGELWRVVEHAAERAPKAVDALLLSPQFGSWLAHALRRLHGATGGPPLWADVGHLACVAVVAVVHAGTSADLTVPTWDGAIALPTLGLLRLPHPEGGFGTQRVAVRAGRITAGPVAARPLLDGATEHWRPLPVLGATGVCLDSLDPYRELDEPVPPAPLSDTETTRWHRLLDDAHAILRRGPAEPDAPAASDARPEPVSEVAAPSLRAGARRAGPAPAAKPRVGEGLPTQALGDITRIVPMGPPHRGHGTRLSASTGDAFGSMIASRPQNALDLAETLVHEFQHSKLAALIHLFPLLADDRTQRYYAPWRADPRHLPGLLHGAYAFTGITGFWRDRMGDRAADPQNTAPFHFALRRLQSRLVVRTLATRADLTPAGRRLITGLAATLDQWLREPVTPDVARRARAAAAGHRAEWRLRHLTCTPAEHAALADAWHSGAAPPPPAEPLLTPADPPHHWEDARIDHYRAPRPGPSADAHLTSGDPTGARLLYTADLTAHPGDPHALAGLLLAEAALTASRRRLLARPERFAAALTATATEPGDPAATRRLAQWLTAGASS
ncbi:HEXXH motif domain-containing protein [Streptomyces sp. NPDC002851]